MRDKLREKGANNSELLFVHLLFPVLFIPFYGLVMLCSCKMLLEGVHI